MNSILIPGSLWVALQRSGSGGMSVVRSQGEERRDMAADRGSRWQRAVAAQPMHSSLLRSPETAL